MENLYWPIYKGIEKEIITLSEQIHFNDEQLSVYSIKISELIIRCAVEIESIVKDLYFLNGGTQPSGRDLYFDTDCFNLLEKEWNLSNKIIIISAPNFFFNSDENRILRPLEKAYKRGSSGPIWARAYQALKHNRSKNLKKGNLKNLIRATSALFILNLYYRNEVVDLSTSNSDKFANEFSNIFTFKVHTWHGTSVEDNHYTKHKDFDECIYLIKWTNDYLKDYLQWVNETNQEISSLILNHPNVKKYIAENFVINGEIDSEQLSDYLQNRKYFEQIDIKTDYGQIINQATRTATKKTKFDLVKRPTKYEAIINKNQDKIYNVDQSSH